MEELMMLCLPSTYVEIQIMPGQLLKLLLWEAKERFQLYSEVRNYQGIFKLQNILQKGSPRLLCYWFETLEINYTVISNICNILWIPILHYNTYVVHTRWTMLVHVLAKYHRAATYISRDVGMKLELRVHELIHSQKIANLDLYSMTLRKVWVHVLPLQSRAPTAHTVHTLL